MALPVQPAPTVGPTSKAASTKAQDRQACRTVDFSAMEAGVDAARALLATRDELPLQAPAELQQKQPAATK
eukprot:5495755-Prorocentrum_lima.AAC.1